jgi:hypothetical protein
VNAGRAPKGNSYCERLVRTVRRECLDFMIPLSEGHLKRTLLSGSRITITAVRSKVLVQVFQCHSIRFPRPPGAVIRFPRIVTSGPNPCPRRSLPRGLFGKGGSVTAGRSICALQALIAAPPTEGSDRSNDSRTGTSLTTQLKISGQENVITVFMIPRGGRTLCPAALKSISL